MKKSEIAAQNRRDAAYWANEWRIRQRRKRIAGIIIAIAAVALAVVLVSYIAIICSRTTYASEDEMREALQGRFTTGGYEDIRIEGDNITLTYYEISHYDRDYAERYGYYETDDSVYEDVVVKWDHRHGIIKCRWMDEIKVDRDGNLVYYSQTLRKTDKPAPVPLDPQTIAPGDSDAADEKTDELDAVQDSLEETEEAAEDAGAGASAYGFTE